MLDIRRQLVKRSAQLNIQGSSDGFAEPEAEDITGPKGRSRGLGQPMRMACAACTFVPKRLVRKASRKRPEDDTICLTFQEPEAEEIAGAIGPKNGALQPMKSACEACTTSMRPCRVALPRRANFPQVLRQEVARHRRGTPSASPRVSKIEPPVLQGDQAALPLPICLRRIRAISAVDNAQPAAPTLSDQSIGYAAFDVPALGFLVRRLQPCDFEIATQDFCGLPLSRTDNGLVHCSNIDDNGNIQEHSKERAIPTQLIDETEKDDASVQDRNSSSNDRNVDYNWLVRRDGSCSLSSNVVVEATSALDVVLQECGAPSRDSNYHDFNEELKNIAEGNGREGNDCRSSNTTSRQADIAGATENDRVDDERRRRNREKPRSSAAKARGRLSGTVASPSSESTAALRSRSVAAPLPPLIRKAQQQGSRQQEVEDEGSHDCFVKRVERALSGAGMSSRMGSTVMEAVRRIEGSSMAISSSSSSCGGKDEEQESKNDVQVRKFGNKAAMMAMKEDENATTAGRRKSSTSSNYNIAHIARSSAAAAVAPFHVRRNSVGASGPAGLSVQVFPRPANKGFGLKILHHTTPTTNSK